MTVPFLWPAGETPPVSDTSPPWPESLGVTASGANLTSSSRKTTRVSESCACASSRTATSGRPHSAGPHSAGPASAGPSGAARPGLPWSPVRTPPGSASRKDSPRPKPAPPESEPRLAPPGSEPARAHRTGPQREGQSHHHSERAREGGRAGGGRAGAGR